jgi:hypothetical protein
MSRKTIDKDTITDLLFKCRRRCCLCYGLDGKKEMAGTGQIAHIDRDNQNNRSSNLAYLCLYHHAIYDSISKQSKGLTEGELSKYREELESYILAEFSTSPPIVISKDVFSGEYMFRGSNEKSTLVLTYLGENFIHVDIFALWGLDRKYGPHIGKLEFVTEIKGNTIRFQDIRADNNYWLEIKFLGESLDVTEDGTYSGMNVHFSGHYFKDLE